MSTVRLIFAAGVVLMAAVAEAQTPQPFPRRGGTPPTPPVARPSPVQPQPAPPVPAPPAQAPPAQAAPARAVPAQTVPAQTVPVQAPAAAPALPEMPVPIYPTAQFLSSYEAGRGQRYYLFGATASFADLVTYYRTQLRERGNQVFDDPPTHMFEIGRFRDESMAFPPSVTIKDWTFGGSQGYPNPRRDGEPARFPTVIMIVPAPPGAAP